MKNVALFVCCSGLLAAPLAVGGETPISKFVDPTVGQLAAYEGKASISQTLGSIPPSSMELTSTLSYLVFAGDKPEDRRVLVLRSVTPQANGLPMPPYSNGGFYWLAKSLELSPVEEQPSSPQMQVLDRHVPASFYPTFTIPDAAESVRVEEVRIVGPAVKLPVQVKVERSGTLLTVTRTLGAGSSPTTDFDGTPCVVNAWKEVHVVDTTRKVLSEVRRELKISGQRGENALVYSQSTEFKAREVRSLGANEKSLFAEIDKEVSGIFGEFSAKKHPREIYQRIQAFLDSAPCKLLPGLSETLLSRLSQYRQARELEQRGVPNIATAYDAPDFTLEDLDGKKVSFREATKGKVVLLNFWGYGCGPCRSEAPYLSKLQEKYGDKGFTVIAVNGYDEDRDTVKGFVEQKQLKQPVLLMGRATAQKQYQVTGFPSNFWIDHTGKVVHKEVGFLPDYFPSMEARLKRMLAASTGSTLESIGR